MSDIGTYAKLIELEARLQKVEADFQSFTQNAERVLKRQSTQIDEMMESSDILTTLQIIFVLTILQTMGIKKENVIKEFHSLYEMAQILRRKLGSSGATAEVSA
jgi:hypothetical protein